MLEGLAYHVVYDAGWNRLPVNLGMGSISPGAKGVLAQCP